jgi:hypothetical protein
MTARRIPAGDAKGAHGGAIASVRTTARSLQPLFLVGVSLRIVLSALMLLGAVYVLRLIGMSDFAGWLVLGLTTGGVAGALLDDDLDLEGRIAEQAARAAVFESDRYGARAHAVRAYAERYLRSRGRLPHALVRLRQPDNHQPFRVYFASRHEQCRRWCLCASLLAARRVAQFVAGGLAVVAAAQIYFLVWL